MADQRPHPTIIMTPPPQAGAPSSSHPRRAAAHRSVSLLHSPRRKPAPPIVQSDSSSEDADPSRRKANGSKQSDSPSSLQPLGRESSGESSNADRWFEQSNNEVRGTSASFADNDPPFFMRHSSSSETPPEAQQQMLQLLGPNDGPDSLPLRTGLLRLGGATDGSSTEDFRGVIDDLTIENKKLKRKLKKYDKLHDAHLKDEKLFEVRIHGLPPDKKRELEETLRKFAASLGTNGFPANGYEGLLPALNAHKTGSSQTSLHHTDSAYASMSASGQGSSAQSGNETWYGQKGGRSTARKQNIHSYLHHIPEGLLPQQNPASMTERAKKKLVVRRLEQIFAGKGATLDGHHHPIQQQEVSQSAARADRAASEAQGHRSRQEGNREAHFMTQRQSDEADHVDGTKTDDNNTSPDDEVAQPGKTNVDATVASQRGSSSKNEQRPTRPLDLDPDRAQVPAENVRYMRHLGFSPPEPGSEKLPQEGHGWIYLNLLVNMAQLHTINVTAEFVRKALTEMSNKFELSHDGRKVRWKGGKASTRASSSSGGVSSRTDGDTPNGVSPRKRPKLSHRQSHQSTGSKLQGSASKSTRGPAENNKLMYTPLFFHKDSTDDADASSDAEDDSESSPYPQPLAGDSSGMTSSGIRTTSSKWKKRKQDDGPIIFYNNARFCTDLSGDRKADGNTNAPPYTTASLQPVGKPQNVNRDAMYEKRGPLAEASNLPEPMDLGDNPIPASMELAFPPEADEKLMRHMRAPIDMEVTGIGGVWPADHFAIAVQSRHARLDQSQPPTAAQFVPKQHLPEKFASIFKQSGSHKTSTMHEHQVVAAKKDNLPPSTLPPPLSFPMVTDTSNDDESDVDDEMSISPVSPDEVAPATCPQPVELHYTSSDEGEEEGDDDDDDEDTDGSLDLLAAAREVDPDAIREQEREYDANMAERLAEDIPAGSSAATAGGGSGFNSPVNNMDLKEHQKAVKEGRARPAGLKRARSTDSMKVQGLTKSNASDERDEDEEMDDTVS